MYLQEADVTQINLGFGGNVNTCLIAVGIFWLSAEEVV